MNIKPISKISAKWKEIASQRGPEYAEGVKNPKTDWADATEGASENYKEGIARSIEKDLFSKGVRKAGTAKWQKRAVEVGASRYPTGIRASEQAFQEGFAPYHQVLTSLDLPPRYPRGDIRNYNRVQEVGKALNEKRMSQ